MATMRTIIPFIMRKETRAKGVSLAARVSNALFGAPNIRRANGILTTRFDIAGFIARVSKALFGKTRVIPVFSIDRIGLPISESLPRIWLSERVSNTRSDDGRRVFVECYPTAPDKGGVLALELGDRYLGEGCSPTPSVSSEERIECFKAAEILYLHAIRRGNRTAAARLKVIYDYDLCEGGYWAGYIESRAKHAKKRARA